MEPSTLNKLLGQYRHALQPLQGAAEANAIIRKACKHHLGDAMPGLGPDRILAPEEERALRNTLDRVLGGEPLQYALGTAEFFGLEIAVDSRVLIPRPETEEMVDLIVRSSATPPDRIIDIGTGSGCIALALKKAFPDAEVIAIDRSADALDLARLNGRANGLAVDWRQMDVLAPGLAGALKAEREEQRTIVVSNPPYVPVQDKASMAPQVLEHEPHIALFVEDDDPHLFYRAIAQAASRSLRPGDELWFEAHYLHAPGTAEVVRGTGFGNVELLHDLSGNPRFIHARK
ncbi:MAG TPA: peptide chain release factor N(5)-glutamine methyltransferase [Flavobacteriales bacterium]|nr:peptide chain release factor N(5)-glutamine methyltransferase [Flavobacteriales bacterium]